jgi:1,4-dihydroxy-2-naphthoate octaprenyltransferase
VSRKVENTESKIGAWIGAMRLRTLPLSFSVIIVGNALVYNYWEICCMFCDDFIFNWSIFGLTLLTTLLLQILSNLANDYGDAKKGADNDDRIGPERAIQSGLISASEMLKAIILFSILSLVAGIGLLFIAFKDNLNITFLIFLILGILSIAAAIKYTVGKSAYGYKAMGDLFVFIFFGLVGVIGSGYLQTQNVNSHLIYAGIAMGALCVAVLNLNNMRDRISDQKVNKNTLAVRLGFKKSKYYHYFLFILAYSCLFPVLFYWHWSSFIYLPVIFIHALHIIKVYKITEPSKFDPELKKIALSTFLLSLIIFGIRIFNYFS